MKQIATLVLMAALAGCALMQPGSVEDTNRAARIGESAGLLSCLLITQERPEAAVHIATAIPVARLVIANGQDIEAMLEALQMIEDERTRLSVVAGVALITSMLDLTPETPIAPGSVVAVGMTAFLDACQAASVQVA